MDAVYVKDYQVIREVCGIWHYCYKKRHSTLEFEETSMSKLAPTHKITSGMLKLENQRLVFVVIYILLAKQAAGGPDKNKNSLKVKDSNSRTKAKFQILGEYHKEVTGQ